jgi:ABC-2 type transport system permease protein
MTTPTNVVSALPVDSERAEPTAASATRPMYWSVRRELWENRSIYVAPLVVGAFILFGFAIYAIDLPDAVRAVTRLDPATGSGGLLLPYCTTAGLTIMAGCLVGAFYCLDALGGERRDRSILFWKSLPVSDRTTVLSKASIPLVVLPVLVFVIVVATHLIMLAVSAAVLLANGMSVAALWIRVPVFRLHFVLIYVLAAVALWHAPVYGWLLLVSGWARRATLLWAVLPPIAICVAERLAFNTTHVLDMLQYRLTGWIAEAFVVGEDGTPIDPLTSLDPAKLLSTPGLWIGLALAAVFIAAVVRLRRYREPI